MTSKVTEAESAEEKAAGESVEQRFSVLVCAGRESAFSPSEYCSGVKLVETPGRDATEIRARLMSSRFDLILLYLNQQTLRDADLLSAVSVPPKTTPATTVLLVYDESVSSEELKGLEFADDWLHVSRLEAELELRLVKLAQESHFARRTNMHPRAMQPWDIRASINQSNVLSVAMSEIPNAVVVMDLELGTEVFKSRNVHETLGYQQGVDFSTNEEFRRLITDPAQESERAAHRQRVQQLADGECSEITHRFRHIDGTWRYVHERAKVVARNLAGKPTHLLRVFDPPLLSPRDD